MLILTQGFNEGQKNVGRSPLKKREGPRGTSRREDGVAQALR